MKQDKPITAFYVEALLMIVGFVGILLALTKIFGLSRNESIQAKLLTNAVTLAQNAADSLIASGDKREGEFVDYYSDDMTPDPNGPLSVHGTWIREGDMMRGTVLVYDSRQKEPLFSLPLSRYVGEVSP